MTFLKTLLFRARLEASVRAASCFAFAGWAIACASAVPSVSNVTAVQREGTRLVDVAYDLSHSEGLTSAVSLEARLDGESWTAISSVSGAVGAGVAVGQGKSVVWNAGSEWPAELFPAVQVRVTASDWHVGSFWSPAFDDLENIGGATLGDGPGGKLGAWVFNGSSALVGPSENVVYGTDMPQLTTVLFWFKTTGRRGIIYCTYDSAGYDELFGVFASVYNRKLYVGGRYNSNGRKDWNVDSGVLVADGAWHKVGIVFDQANGEVTVYLDGSNVGSTAIPVDVDHRDGGRVRFGANRFSGNPVNDPFTGSVYGAKIFKEVLSAEAIDHELGSIGN